MKLSYKQKNYVWVLCSSEFALFFSLADSPGWSHPLPWLQWPPTWLPSVYHPIWMPQAAHIQCVHNCTCLLLKPVLQCMVPPCVLLETNMSFPLPPSFLTSNPFFFPPLKCPLSLSICTFFGHDISCLDYPSISDFPGTPASKKPSSQS